MFILPILILALVVPMAFVLTACGGGKEITLTLANLGEYGEETKEVTVTSNNRNFSVDVPTLDGMVFKGFFNNRDGSGTLGQIITEEGKSRIGLDKAQTLWARWELDMNNPNALKIDWVFTTEKDKEFTGAGLGTGIMSPAGFITWTQSDLTLLQRAQRKLFEEDNTANMRVEMNAEYRVSSGLGTPRFSLDGGSSSTTVIQNRELSESTAFVNLNAVEPSVSVSIIGSSGTGLLRIVIETTTTRILTFRNVEMKITGTLIV